MELALDGLGVADASELAIGFQSLFSWNLLLMFDKVLDLKSLMAFQSLFSWNLLLMFGMSNHSREGLWVSILVFVELALDAGGYRRHRYKRARRFNPCFRGTCS